MQRYDFTDKQPARLATLLAVLLALVTAVFALVPAVGAEGPDDADPLVEEPAEDTLSAGQQTPPPGLSGRWIVEVSFKNNQIVARRINRVLMNGNIVAERTQRLRCRPKGAVTLGPDSAQFAGGYIVCNFPSFRQAFNRMTPPGSPQLTQTTTVPIEEVDVWVDLEASNVDFNAATVHPVVSHPAYLIDYSLTYSKVPEAFLQVDAWKSVSPELPLTGTQDRIGSRVNECDAQRLECRMRHRVNGAFVVDETVDHVPPWTVFNDRSIIYIGRNGADRFIGEMSWIRYDPGVFVRTG